jgi:hypothetical protein
MSLRALRRLLGHQRRLVENHKPAAISLHEDAGAEIRPSADLTILGSSICLFCTIDLPDPRVSFVRRAYKTRFTPSWKRMVYSYSTFSNDAHIAYAAATHPVLDGKIRKSVFGISPKPDDPLSPWSKLAYFFRYRHIPYAIEQGIFRVLSVKICLASGKQIASSSSASATLSACEFIRERRHWVYASQLGFLFGYLARFAGRQLG